MFGTVFALLVFKLLESRPLHDSVALLLLQLMLVTLAPELAHTNELT